MLKLINDRGESYGNLYDKVTMYYQSHLTLYVGDEVIIDRGNGKTSICTVTDNRDCRLMGLGFLYPNERFVGFKRRASALKLGEIVGNGTLRVVDVEGE